MLNNLIFQFAEWNATICLNVCVYPVSVERSFGIHSVLTFLKVYWWVDFEHFLQYTYKSTSIPPTDISNKGMLAIHVHCERATTITLPKFKNHDIEELNPEIPGTRPFQQLHQHTAFHLLSSKNVHYDNLRSSDKLIYIISRHCHLACVLGNNFHIQFKKFFRSYSATTLISPTLEYSLATV